jgi:hypothetical protein
MPVHKWQLRETTHFGEVWVPFAQVDIKGSDGRFRSFGLQIDSGAVVSLLRQSAGELLGIDVEQGRRIELGSVGGSTTVAYVHKFTTRFSDNLVFPVEFAIADNESVPNLLGRRDVFDSLQVDFDSTLANTKLAPRWLDDQGKRLWDALNSANDRVAQCWMENPLAAPGDEAALALFNRAGQLFATAAVMMRSFCTWDAPLIIRAMFELSLQFEYLLQSPAERGKRYLDFSKITRHLQSRRIARNPKGRIGQQIASSPLRSQGELRNKQEYEAVAFQFRRGKQKDSLWDAWYCMSLADLADKLDKRGEYDIWYKAASAWAHGDSFAISHISARPISGAGPLFVACLFFYGRMLLQVAEAKKILLTSEQYELLKACLTSLD